MKLPAPLPGALDDDAASLEASLLEDVAPPPPAKEDHTVAVVCACGAAVAALVFGYSLGFSSPALPGMLGRQFRDVECDANGASAAQASLWSAIINLGAAMGALAGGRLVDNIGRKGALLYVAGPLYVVAWAATARAHGPHMLISARVLLGGAVGISSVAVPVYVAETAPASLRGALGSVTQLAVTLGILLAYVAGALAPHEVLEYACGHSRRGAARGAWRSLALLGATLGLCVVGAASLLPESPAWLVAKRRRAAAARALTTLRGGDDARAARDLDALVRSTGGADDGLGVRVVLAALCGGGDAGVRRPLAIILMVMLFQQFSGINAVIFYSGSLLASAGMANGDLGGVLVMAVQVLATGLALVLMDRLGRRVLLTGSLGGMAVAAALLALHFVVDGPPFIALFALFLYIAAFSLGLGPVPWLLMGELLPTRARGAAASLATVLNWSCSFLVTETFASLVAHIGSGGAFFGFACVCVVGAAYVAATVPETKGLRLDEVEALFLGSTARRSI